MNSLRVLESGDGSSLEVYLRTRSSRPGVGGVREGALELKVGAPPVEGRANEAARRLLAEILGVPPSRVELKSGAKARKKVFLVKEMGLSEMQRLLDERIKIP